MKAKTERGDKMRAEYVFDYRTAERGKYYKRLLKEGANIVVLEPDVAKAFRSSPAVNEALRTVLALSDALHRLTAGSRGRSKRSAGARTRSARRTTRR